MSKSHDAVFDDCMSDFELPAAVAGAAATTRGGPLIGALAHDGVTKFGEAVCDETITSGALGPPASYIYAKLGYDPATQHPPQFGSDLDEAVPQAHLERNHWQSDLLPDEMPRQTPYLDPQTGVLWTSDNAITESIWHGASNDCFRGELPADHVAALRADPAYRDAFAELAGHHGYSVDLVTPGAQVCYDSTTGGLVESGPHAGTWDFASPNVEGQSAVHWNMDVSPDWSADNYTSFNNSKGQDTGFHGSGDTSTVHDSGWGYSDSGHFEGDSGGGGYSGGQEG